MLNFQIVTPVLSVFVSFNIFPHFKLFECLCSLQLKCYHMPILIPNTVSVPLVTLWLAAGEN